MSAKITAASDGTSLTLSVGTQDVATFFAAGGVSMQKLPFSKDTNGYVTLPNGLILQWGQCSNDNGQFNGGSLVTFPIPFPTAVLHVSVEAYAGQMVNGAGLVSARLPFGSGTNSYAIVAWYNAANALTTDQNAGQWFAIGY